MVFFHYDLNNRNSPGTHMLSQHDGRQTCTPVKGIIYQKEERSTCFRKKNKHGVENISINAKSMHCVNVSTVSVSGWRLNSGNLEAQPK